MMYALNNNIGGRLSNESVYKILRSAYKLLVTFPNTKECVITKYDKLVIVGDLHGKLTDSSYTNPIMIL